MSKKIERVENPTWIEANKLINKLRKSGKLFRVDFVKRTDESVRSMVCRFGVKSEFKGGKSAYAPYDKDLLVVYEPFVGYRSIPMETIIIVKTDATLYDFRQLNMLRSRPVPIDHRKKVPVIGW